MQHSLSRRVNCIVRMIKDIFVEITPGRSSCSKKEPDITGHQHHQPALASLAVLWVGRIIDNHLVSVLADQGKGKVWSHEENKVPHKGDHLGLI